VLAIVPYTQVEVTERIGLWILASPILGVVLGIVGFLRVRREVKLLDQIRELYRRLQDSLFFKFHEDKKSGFGVWILLYIFLLIALATINTLLMYPLWIRPALY
jgi:phosphate/sulfate permease